MHDLSKKVAAVINVRKESTRIKNKVLSPFCGSSLFEIALRKLLTSKIIASQDILVATDEYKYAPDFSNIIKKVNEDTKLWFHSLERSKLSCVTDTDQYHIYQFYKYLIDHEYDSCILINVCCPLLSIQTIDAFYSTFKYSNKDGLFGVLKKKNYIWDDKQRPFNLPGKGEIMNTKNEECTIYEAAHCLYGSKLSLIPERKFMGGFTELGPELFILPENQTFDIDYPWQFEYAQILYKGLNNL